MSEAPEDVAEKLNSMLVHCGQVELNALEAESFSAYLDVLMRWNERMNLTAVRDVDGILQRHFVESIACARVLPQGIATLLDLGSGAGFPGLPITICRPEIRVTLAESQGKKAAFLNEAARVVGVAGGERIRIHAGRAEGLKSRFDCVTMRAVDRMGVAVKAGARLVREGGWLAPMTTTNDVAFLREVAGEGFEWTEPVALQCGTDRVLLFGQRSHIV